MAANELVGTSAANSPMGAQLQSNPITTQRFNILAPRNEASIVQLRGERTRTHYLREI
jgi:hypothetical protein